MADQPAPVVDLQSEPSTVALPPAAEPPISAETQSSSTSATTPTSDLAMSSLSPQVVAPLNPTPVSVEAGIETTPLSETESAPSAETEPILVEEPETMTKSLVAVASLPKVQTVEEVVAITSPSSRNLSAPPQVVRADSSPAALPSQETSPPHDPSSPMISAAITSSPSEIKFDPMLTSSPSKIGHSKSMSSAVKNDDDDDDRPSLKHVDSGFTLVSDGLRKHIHEARDTTLSFMKNELRTAAIEVAGDIHKKVHKLHDLARGSTEDSGSVHSRKSDVDASSTSIVEKGLSRVKTLKTIKIPKVTRPNLNFRASSSTVQKLVPGLRSTRGEKTEAPSS